jgi:hypothetical protein
LIAYAGLGVAFKVFGNRAAAMTYLAARERTSRSIAHAASSLGERANVDVLHRQSLALSTCAKTSHGAVDPSAKLPRVRNETL